MRTALLPGSARRSTILVAAMLALLATLLPVVASPALADSGLESQFVAVINQERAAKGLPALKVANDLTSVARAHSKVMGGKNDLHHNPNLGSDVSGWKKVGENVGRGQSVNSLHAAFMASPAHKQNILDADWTQLGIGVVVVDGKIWVTQVYRLPAGTPKPAPAPAPEADTSPAPAPKAASGAKPAAAEAPAADDAPSKATPDPDPQPEPEPAPEPEPHEVIDQPLPLDRITLTLARLEATERSERLDDVLAG